MAGQNRGGQQLYPVFPGQVCSPNACCERELMRRIRVEEEYIAGLKRVYSRSKAIDSLHDE